MPVLSAKKACERRLSTLSLPTAYEGISFTPPSGLYLATQLKVNTPDEPTIGDTYYRERITFQVFVCDVLNKGTGNALAVVEQVRDLFPKGLTLTEGAYTIHFLNQASVKGSVVTEDRLVYPVMIDMFVEVYS
jgi:hypothetical protein